jgi:hypothetical protein
LRLAVLKYGGRYSNYLDAEIPADLRESREKHFSACTHCTAVLDGTRNVVASVGDGTLFQMPEGFSKRLYEKIRNLPSPNAPRD